MEAGIGMITLVSPTSSSSFFGGNYTTNILYHPTLVKIHWDFHVENYPRT